VGSTGIDDKTKSGKGNGVITDFSEAGGGSEASKNCEGVGKTKASASNVIEYENLFRSN